MEVLCARTARRRRHCPTKTKPQFQLRRTPSLTTLWLTSHILLWGLVSALGFFLLGTLRALARVQWRLDQIEATTPRQIGRDGLKVGAKAPDFSLPSTDGGEVALGDYARRAVLLVFTQSGCAPCREIVPELNQHSRHRDIQVLVVNRGSLETSQQWAADTQSQFPVLVQEGLAVSKRYEVFATPFAFVIDESGYVAARGIVHSSQHLRFLLGDADQRRADAHHAPPEALAAAAS